MQRCSVARAHSLQARLLVVSCISRYPMLEKRVPRSAMARECRSLLLLVLAEVEAVEAVQAVQRCFEEDVQQCLDACPRSLRVRSRGRYVSQVNAVRQTDGPRRVPQRSKDLIQNGYER